MKFVALLAFLYCSATLVRAALTGVPQYGYVATQYTGNLPGLTFGMAWRDDGTMIVARNAALCSVPPGGGVCTPLPQGNYQAHGLTRDLEGNFWGYVNEECDVTDHAGLSLILCSNLILSLVQSSRQLQELEQHTIFTLIRSVVTCS